MPICACSVADAPPAVEIYCCEALPAWQRGDWFQAERAAAKALASDPVHRPSALLHGLAQLHTGEIQAGVEELDALRTDPRVGRLASQAVRKHDNRWNRDQISVSTGAEVGTGGGLAFSVAFPFTSGLSVRADAASINHWQRNLNGWTFGLDGLADVWSDGGWRLAALAGVYDTQRNWPQQDHLPGLRAGMLLDLRVRQHLGGGVELGWSGSLRNGGLIQLPYFRLVFSVFGPSLRPDGSPSASR